MGNGEEKTETYVTYRTMEMLGEFQRDRLLSEERVKFKNVYGPAYKDRIKYKDNIYIVQDVLLDEDKNNLEVLAIRRIR
jgi:uncharacterized lipoprotein YehR (DUF1307 family)